MYRFCPECGEVVRERSQGMGALGGFFEESANEITEWAEWFVGLQAGRARPAHIRSPVFLFHARDDDDASFAATESFGQSLKALGQNVTFVPVDDGGHYDSMIEVGMPKAIEWLRSLSR